MAKSEYYKTRLEHTSQDTRGYTRLIYVVNAGVLALLFLAIEHGDKLKEPVLVARTGLIVLALINVFHGLFMFRQRDWYRRLDSAYAASVDVDLVPSGKWYLGGHALYAYMHFVLALVLVLAAVYTKSFVSADGQTQ